MSRTVSRNVCRPDLSHEFLNHLRRFWDHTRCDSNSVLSVDKGVLPSAQFTFSSLIRKKQIFFVFLNEDFTLGKVKHSFVQRLI